MKILFILFSFVTIPVFAQVKQLTLSLGESKTLSLKGSSVWIQDKNILMAEGAGNHLILRGKIEGGTILKAGSDTYEVQVLHPLKKEAFEDFSKYLEKIVGLKVTVKDGTLVVEGQLYRLQDWLKISEYAKRKYLSYQFEVTVTPQIEKEMQTHFAQLLASSKLPPLTLSLVPRLEVRAKGSALTIKKYKELLKPWGIELIQDDEALQIAPTIKVQITVAEIKKSFSQTIGLKWPGAYSAKILSSGQRETDDLPFQLNALEAQGLGKILASPNIIARSGEEAEFLAGGEFPIKVVSLKLSSIIWKKYGVFLKVKPKADAAGRMSISIETEVSTIDDSRTVDGIPGILMNKVSSHFDLTQPRTIALSGLIRNQKGHSSDGLPFLSRLPILGSLFSSKDFQEDRSELVIFVRPSILQEETENQKPEHLKPFLTEEEL